METHQIQFRRAKRIKTINLVILRFNRIGGKFRKCEGLNIIFLQSHWAFRIQVRQHFEIHSL